MDKHVINGNSQMEKNIDKTSSGPVLAKTCSYADMQMLFVMNTRK